MLRRVLLAVGVLLTVVIILFVFRKFFVGKLIVFLIKPSSSFEETVPPAPDYAQQKSWAALPDREDNADVLPAADVSDNQDTAAVDVFFIHPTTYYSNDGWNQPQTDKRANEFTDKGVLRNQASVFNSCGRIYAPRYRQATLYSFMVPDGDGGKALELAYQDVKRAFEHYLEHYNEGRPIILASHSQGSRHGARLLEDFFSGKPLLDKLVGAYLIGWGGADSDKYDNFPDIPVCETPEQTNCWITWNTMGPKADRSRSSKSAVCVNPLTWTIDESYADRSLNLGGVVFQDEGNEPPSPDVGVVDAQCREGVLWVSSPEAEGYSSMLTGRDNYHVLDYSLFHMNIRKNVEERVTAYLRGSTNAMPR